MLYRDDDDTDNNEHDCNDGVVMHDGRHAGELYQSIDEGDRRFTSCDGTTDNATTVAITMNGDNHFPQERREKQRRGAKGVHIVGRNEAGSFGT